MPLNEKLKTDYNDKYNQVVIRKGLSLGITLIVTQIEHNRERYQKVSEHTGVPWFIVGVIHHMECGGDFSCHLHNGDSLARKTIHEPPGRPPVWPPLDSKADRWVESALDALRYDGFDVWRDWSVAGTLYKLELYNGWGYRNRGVNSPYLFGATNLYTSGKYVEVQTGSGKVSKFVSVFRPGLVSKQIGAAALLKEGEKCQLIQFPDRQVKPTTVK